MYIGWDIGIKNLSYCLLDVVNNTTASLNDKAIINIGNKKFILVDWGVINILNDVTNNTPCFENRKKVDCGFGKCKKKATYIHQNKNGSNYFGLCTIHYKKVNDENKKEFIMLEKKPKCFNVKCNKSSLYYDKNHEFKTYCEWMGQRTWTTMVYLNDVEEGGETYFKHLKLKIKPQKGLLLAWNNLFFNGIPNYKTLHEALPPISGDKYIITKWWRSWSLI